MRETKTQDPETGLWYREIIYNNYKRLRELKFQYDELGIRSWLNVWDPITNEWILTIEMGKNYAR